MEQMQKNKPKRSDNRGHLQLLNNPNIRYTACVCPDNKTFIHTAFFKSDDDQKVLFALHSFKNFQEQLKTSMPEVPPQNEILTLIGSSNDIF